MSSASTCCCGRIAIGMTVTDQRNWNPDCVEHGVESAWWKSPEQVAKREKRIERTRGLQQQTREVRRRARGN